jgi:quinolinate synthase
MSLPVIGAAPSAQDDAPLEGGLDSINARIEDLKREREVFVIAHNYQYPEVQAIADARGDALEVSFAAARARQPNILFCGVDFMAETAKLINPDKRVMIPDDRALCPLAAMSDVEGLRLLKERYPNAAVVAYMNSSAAVKAEADICCAAANAVAVCKSVEAREIIFAPDQNLGQYVQRFLPDKKIVIWPGYCHVHQNMTVDELSGLKAQHPGAEVIVHVETPPDVIDMADHAFSTGGMMRHVRESPKREFIIATERDMVYALKRDNPGKVFYTAARAVCPTHKKITLRKVLRTLETMSPEVQIDPDIARRARASVEKMLQVKGRD